MTVAMILSVAVNRLKLPASFGRFRMRVSMTPRSISPTVQTVSELGLKIARNRCPLSENSKLHIARMKARACASGKRRFVSMKASVVVTSAASATKATS